MSRFLIFTAILTVQSLFAGETEDRISELNAYWSEVSRAVKAGDFEGYRATCHPEGVLVSGTKKTSYPLSTALEKWKPGILDTKAGRNQASVEFRFSDRVGDASTAHETGMFCYSSTDAEGVSTTSYIHLRALLVKKDGRWLILMENQESEGTAEEWKALPAYSAE